MSDVSHQDIDAIVALFQESNWEEMHLTLGGTELFLSKHPDAKLPGPQSASTPETAPAIGHRATVEASPVPRSSATPSKVPAGWTVVRAPSLGSFYRAPKPGAAAFCAQGDTIGPEDELCLIEVMKLFTTVRAGVAGILREIYVKDGDMVEFDQPLFLVEPHG